ncbi:hypothetical protein GJ496_008332 [Pomphorhynchus laevis]|nr:hypothetical protein GJ496_008332 [Pomphorhynchus laevis]
MKLGYAIPDLNVYYNFLLVVDHLNLRHNRRPIKSIHFLLVISKVRIMCGTPRLVKMKNLMNWCVEIFYRHRVIKFLESVARIRKLHLSRQVEHEEEIQPRVKKAEKYVFHI